MATKKTLSEAEVMEKYRVALENVTAQPIIATKMAELGYDSATIEEGKSILAATRAAYDFNKTEGDETNASYDYFESIKEELDEIYSLHRKKGKIIFKNDFIILEKLGLTGTLPQAYIKWLEVVKKFYTETSSDKALQQKLSRLLITKKDITGALKLISQLEAARSEYLKENSEDQEATLAKDKAFAKVDDWMSEFYAVAKIGLEDNPQLLEALGKIIRN